MPLSTEPASAQVSKQPEPQETRAAPVETNTAPSKTEPTPVSSRSVSDDQSFDKKVDAEIKADSKTDKTEPKHQDKEPPKDKEPQQSNTRVAAMIARKEKEIRRKQDELKAEYDRIRKVEQQAKSLLDAVSKAKDDPAALAEAAGIPLSEYYQKLTSKILSGGKEDPKDMIAKHAQELAELKAELKRRDEEEKSNYLQSSRQSYISLIEKTANENKDKYEMLSVFGKEGAEEVLNLQIKHFNKTEKALTDDDAMSRIEEGLRETVKAELERLSNTKFFDEFVNGLVAKKKSSATLPAQATKAALKTLTQSTNAAPPVRETRKKSRSEEFEEFIGRMSQ